MTAAADGDSNGRAASSHWPDGWWSSPARASPRTRASRISEGRRACGPRTPGRAPRHVGRLHDRPEVRRRAWQVRLHSPAWEARPNAGHRALVELERDGGSPARHQNIDGLHQLAGNDPHRVVESTAPCATSCACAAGPARPPRRHRTGARRREGPALRDDVRRGELRRHSQVATISFGQQLSVIDLARAQLAVEDADVLLCVGTSLGVYPAAGLVPGAGCGGQKS